MPKYSRERILKFNKRMVEMYPNILDIESCMLFCKVCYCNINGNKTYSVQQHFRTIKHQTAVATKAEQGETPPPSIRTEFNTFCLDLCTTFLEAHIPLETVNNPAIQIFLSKYIPETIPTETILRTEYVPALSEKYIQKLRAKAKNKPIWISVTESFGANNQLIVNFVFGVIEENEKGKCYLLNIDRLERANPSSLAAFFNYSLQILWPKRILYENIYLVVTDTVPYIVTAIQSLKILYPNMIHVNCLLQSMDKLVQFIRIHFSQVDAFIITCEEVFLKSPHRLHLLRSKYKSLNIPSQTTASSAPARTWLNAAIYYSDNFSEINALLNVLSEEEDVECIQQARELIKTNAIESDLVYLKQNFESVSQAISKLENRDLILNQSLAAIELIKTAIQDTNRLEFISKFEQIVNENSGLQKLIAINSTDTDPLIQRSIYKSVPIVSANIDHLWYARNLLVNDKSGILDPKIIKTEI